MDVYVHIYLDLSNSADFTILGIPHNTWGDMPTLTTNTKYQPTID